MGPVFGSYDRNNMSRTLCALGYPAEVTHPGHGPIPEATLFSALAKVMAPTPRKIRDKALVLLAYGAYLSTQETVRLRADEVRRAPRGLVVSVRGRRHPVGVARGNDPRFCPVIAWEEWERVKAATPELGSCPAAFLGLDGETLRPEAMRPAALNKVIEAYTQPAGLVGPWAFRSLRQGAIHASIRAGVPTHVIAQVAGLDCLGSVEVYERREELVRGSVAGCVGL